MSSDDRMFLHELARGLENIDDISFPPPCLEYLIVRKIVHADPEVLCLDIVTPYFSFEYSSIDDLMLIANMCLFGDDGRSTGGNRVMSEIKEELEK